MSYGIGTRRSIKFVDKKATFHIASEIKFQNLPAAMYYKKHELKFRSLKVNIAYAGMLAPDGRCKTLDSTADGYVRAETCIMLLLESAEDVLSQCVAILRGTAVNQVCLSISVTLYARACKCACKQVVKKRMISLVLHTIYK